jgi:hypothetical protein
MISRQQMVQQACLFISLAKEGFRSGCSLGAIWLAAHSLADPFSKYVVDKSGFVISRSIPGDAGEKGEDPLSLPCDPNDGLFIITVDSLYDVTVSSCGRIGGRVVGDAGEKGEDWMHSLPGGSGETEVIGTVQKELQEDTQNRAEAQNYAFGSTAGRSTVAKRTADSDQSPAPAFLLSLAPGHMHSWRWDRRDPETRSP